MASPQSTEGRLSSLQQAGTTESLHPEGEGAPPSHPKRVLRLHFWEKLGFYFCYLR